MEKEKDSGNFTTKYFGKDNPININLPPSEYKGGKYVDIEVGAFFFNISYTALDTATPTLDPITVVIPGISTGNFNIDGTTAGYVTLICPDDYEIMPLPGGNMKVNIFYKYSPGRPDLYLIPPAPTVKIELRDKTGNLINFSSLNLNYYISFNIGY